MIECDERARRAAELGLEKTATWEEIANFMSEQRRVRDAAELGLEKTATWWDIYKAMPKGDRR